MPPDEPGLPGVEPEVGAEPDPGGNGVVVGMVPDPGKAGVPGPKAWPGGVICGVPWRDGICAICGVPGVERICPGGAEVFTGRFFSQPAW